MQEKALTQIEQLVEQTVRLEQMEDDYGVDMADVFLKSIGDCSQVYLYIYFYSECNCQSAEQLPEGHVQI